MQMREMYHEGSIHQKTRCWAQGMEGWKALDQIAQLKWTLVATGVSLLNESDLASLIMEIFIRICGFYPSRDSDGCIIRPLPRAKRVLTEPNALPHLVQLLLTFDPRLVEKVVTLLNLVVEDNPQLPRLFSTGVFFFVMMYTGANILPIARFLKYTHMKQSFRPDEVMHNVYVRKRLGHMTLSIYHVTVM